MHVHPPLQRRKRGREGLKKKRDRQRGLQDFIPQSTIPFLPVSRESTRMSLALASCTFLFTCDEAIRIYYVPLKETICKVTFVLVRFRIAISRFFVSIYLVNFVHSFILRVKFYMFPNIQRTPKRKISGSKMMDQSEDPEIYTYILVCQQLLDFRNLINNPFTIFARLSFFYHLNPCIMNFLHE